MSIELRMGGKCKKMEMFREEVKKLVGSRGDIYVEYSDVDVIETCHLGDIVINRQGKDITIKTSPHLIGAGYHKYVCDLFADISNLLKKPFVIDSTGYFEHRDFEKLREENYYSHLESIMLISYEQTKGGGESRIYWDVNKYTPRKISDSVVTPFGRLDLADVMIKIGEGHINEVAEDFYMWNNSEKDAMCYRNQALALMWEDILFISKGVKDREDRLCDKAIKYIEKAIELDSSIPIPKDEYLELCKLQEKEAIDVSNLKNYSSKYQIGYHKDFTFVRFGEINLPIIPRMFRNDSEEVMTYDSTNQDGLCVRISAYEMNVMPDEIFENRVGELIEIEIENAVCKMVYKGMAGDQHHFMAVVLTNEQLTSLFYYCDKKEIEEKAVEHLKLIECFR